MFQLYSSTINFKLYCLIKVGRIRMGQVCTQHTHTNGQRSIPRKVVPYSAKVWIKNCRKMDQPGITNLKFSQNLPNSTDSNDSRVHFPPFSVQKWPSRYPYHWRRPCRNPAAWLSKCQMGAAVFDVSFNKKVLVLLICFSK